MADQPTVVNGAGYILGIPGNFANAMVRIDADGQTSTQPLGISQEEEASASAEPAQQEAPPVQAEQSTEQPVQEVQPAQPVDEQPVQPVQPVHNNGG